MARCLSCNSVLTHLNRNIGTGPLNLLNGKRLETFFDKCRAKRLELGNSNLSYKMVRQILSDTLTEQQISSSSQEVSGDYLPLAVWEKKGFDTELIKAFNRSKWNPACGLCFQCPIFSENWKNTQRTVDENLAAGERAFKKRKGGDALLDDDENQSEQKKGRCEDDDGSETAEDVQEQEDDEDDECGDDKKSSDPVAALQQMLMATLQKVAASTAAPSAPPAPPSKEKPGQEEAQKAKELIKARKRAERLERKADQEEQKIRKKELAEKQTANRKVVAFSTRIEALIKPKFEENEQVMKRLGDMVPVPLSREFEAIAAEVVPILAIAASNKKAAQQKRDPEALDIDVKAAQELRKRMVNNGATLQKMQRAFKVKS